jgi:Tol biopolymer transport system component/predicted Ser/Thr protein kinase
MTLTAGSKLGPYEIVAPLGAGGMGEVYLARDPRVGRDVAIKVSTEQFSERFEREARTVASLNHSNICTLYDVGPNYLVMELIEGPTLADRIKQGRIPLEESLEIARQIADALEAAHEKGIVHRDLKPGNIKVKADGTVKVLDFGLAKVGGTPVVSSDNSPTLSVAQTAAGVILGTAAYMSPEQAKGKVVDKRADIWSFGVVLYEMLTGKQLFVGETVSDILASVIKEDPDWEKVPAKAQRLLRSCLQKDPKGRLADISDAKLLLDDVPESVPTKRPWLAWSTVALLLIAFFLLAFVHFRDKAPIATEPVRFQIAFPDKVVPAGSEPFALSPDGRRLAFAGRGPDGVARLWIRSLDSLEVRPLLGSELNSSSVGFCFWSPDSRFIAFDAGGQLKKIDLSGGQPQILCDLSGSALGGSWNRDGTIILGNGGGLMRVSDNGGDLTPLTRLDRSRQENEHVLPSFLPDGRHFIYFRNSGIPENAGMYVGSLDARPEEQRAKRLVKTLRAAVYAPSRDSSTGHLLFLREGTLLAQAFDDRRLELTGEPVAVAEQVNFFRAGGFFSVSTNGILAYRSGGAWLVHNQQATWFDRQGKVLGAAGEVGAQWGLALSPDGARAAYSSSQRITFDLWLLEFARGTNMRFTFGQGDSRDPIWSPDGSRIVFGSNRDGTFNLYQKMASGIKSDELLLKSSEDKIPTSWSSDGRFLLYTVIDPKTKSDLWILPLQGKRTPIPFLRSEFNEQDGHFSPDMRWIAYTSDESGSNEIYVQEFSQRSGGASSETGGKLLVSKGGGSGARWRGDGKELFYRAPDGTVMALEVTAGPVFQAGTPKPLFLAQFTQAPLPDWDVASNGKRFLISIPSGGGGTPTPFTVVLNWTALVKK